MQHYTKNTVSASVWCKPCNGFTQHRIDDGRVGPCLACIEKLDASNARAREERKASTAVGQMDLFFAVSTPSAPEPGPLQRIWEAAQADPHRPPAEVIPFVRTDTSWDSEDVEVRRQWTLNSARFWRERADSEPDSPLRKDREIYAADLTALAADMAARPEFYADRPADETDLSWFKQGGVRA